MFGLFLPTSALFAGLLCLLSGAVSGQEYPTKPIRIVVANSAGSTPDLIARILAPDMSNRLGVPVVIDNKPGGFFIVGFEHVAKAAPADGYTVAIVAIEALASLPVLVKDLRFDPLNDLAPVVGVVEGRFVLTSASHLPWATFNELVASAKAQPGKLNYGAASPTSRIQTEALIRLLGINVVSIPYANSGGLYQGLASGEVHMGFVTEPVAATLKGKLRPIAVTGETRSEMLREVPTLLELGAPNIPGYGYSLNVRVGTPAAAQSKLYSAVSQTLENPNVQSAFDKLQLYIIKDNTAEAMTKRLAGTARLFIDIAKQAGITPQ